ncbi:MAG TPA: hypothetical protein VLH94_02985 [Spirochaetia bacterium]|nr:hypothetical protein [Spirochaetia bacterium]
MSYNTELTELISTLTPARQEYVASLLKLSWFQNTAPEIQEEVLTLPEDFDGFIKDLSERPDEIGNVEVQRLQKLNRGNYLLIPVFEVRSESTNQIFTYEYVSWKTGQHGGMRGIIFLETNGKITHFIVNRAHKFSTTREVLDSIGGLFLRIDKNNPTNFPQKIEQEICHHLGIKNLTFKKIVDLGRVFPDYGMTNNSSYLFAAIIDVTNFPNVTNKSDFYREHKPMGLEIEIVHVSEFFDFVKKTEDNYFLGAAARVLVSKEIDLEI